MMKRIILSILLSVICSFFYAQEYSFSDPIRLTNKTPRFKILGKNSRYILAERWGAKTHYIDIYAHNLKRINSKELKTQKNEEIHKIWIQPKRNWLVVSESKKDYTLLKAKELDSKFNPKSKPLILDSIIERKDLAQENLRTKQSLNEKYLAAYLPIFSKGLLDNFSVKVFNSKMQKTQELKLKSVYLQSAKFVSLLVLNDGAVAVVFRDKKNLKKYKIFYSDRNREILTHSVELDNRSFKKVKIAIDNKTQEMIFAGFSESLKGKSANGFFTFKLNLEKGEKSKVIKEIFTNELYKNLTGKESKKEEITLKTFRVKNVISKTDGGYLVFAESYYINQEVFESNRSGFQDLGISFGGISFTPSSSYKTNFYHYNDIIVYTIDNKLNIENVNIIKKRQKSTDDNGGYSSYCIHNLQDELGVIFLDDISTDSSLKNYSLNEDSELTKENILSVQQNDIMPVVKMSKQTTPNELLIPSYLNNSFSIIKIVFNN